MGEIARVKTGPRDKPVDDVVIKKVIISHARPAKGASAKPKAKPTGGSGGSAP